MKHRDTEEISFHAMTFVIPPLLRVKEIPR